MQLFHGQINEMAVKRKAVNRGFRIGSNWLRYFKNRHVKKDQNGLFQKAASAVPPALRSDLIGNLGSNAAVVTSTRVTPQDCSTSSSSVAAAIGQHTNNYIANTFANFVKTFGEENAANR